MARLVLLATAAVAAVAAGVSDFGRVRFETDVPVTYDASAWAMAGPSPPSTMVNLVFALKHSNAELLERHFWGVSDPASPLFRKYWGKWEVDQMTRPADAERAALVAHLRAAGAVSVDASRTHFLETTFPLPAAEALMGVNFFMFVSKSDPDVLYHRALEHYSLPDHMAPLVDFVSGVTRLPKQPHLESRAFNLRGTGNPFLDGIMRLGDAPVVLSPPVAVDTWTLIHSPLCPDASAPAPDMTCSDGAHVSVAGSTITVLFETVDLDTVYNTTIVLSKDELQQQCAPCPDVAELRPTVQGVNTEALCKRLQRSAGSASAPLLCATPLFPVSRPLEFPTCRTLHFDVVTTFSTGTTSAMGGAIALAAPPASPAFLRNWYGVPAWANGSQPDNSMAVAEFLEQYYDPADLGEYLDLFGLPGTDRDVRVVGPNNASDPGGEATLDIEVIMALAPNVSTTFWSVAGRRNNSAPPSLDNQEPFMRWILDVLSSPSPPLVHSVSYDDDEDTMPRAFTDRLNVEFQKAGLQGLTVLFAAGDDGAGGINVRTNGSAACSPLTPAFPAGSPYVVAVGGTQLLSGSGPMGMEEVVSSSATGSFITTGGGFSNRYDAPSYQTDAVARYLQTSPDLPPDTYFRATGRAYPDISAIAHNFPIIMKSTQQPIGGTSASTPVIAALFALVNDARLAAGKQPIGFVNPSLYSIFAQSSSPAFTDVVRGDNKCSADPTKCCDYGFSATPGWDASTGLGVPRFHSLLQALLQQP